MNVSEAIAHLKRLGWHVSKEGKDYRAHRIGYKKYCHSLKWPNCWNAEDSDLFTPRELVKLAKVFSAENNQSTAIKKAVKSGQKVERRIVRDTISKGDTDKMDEIFTDKLEDVWNYD